MAFASMFIRHILVRFLAIAMTSSRRALACALPIALLLSSSSASESVLLTARSYGALGDGATDDTTALQSWINACQATGKTCYLDAGTYRTSSCIAVTSAVHLVGVSSIQSTIKLSGPTQNGFCITTVLPTFWDDIGFISATTPTAGSAFLIDTGGAPLPSVASATAVTTGGFTTGAVATSAPHGLLSGQNVTFTGFSPSGWNGSWKVAVTGASTFTVVIGTTASPVATASVRGTIVGPSLNYESQFNRINTYGLCHSFTFNRAAYWTISHFRGSETQCEQFIIQNLAQPDEGDWSLGPDITSVYPAVSLWNSAQSYKVGDVTFLDGGRTAYAATAPSTNEAPPNASYWTVKDISHRNHILMTSSGGGRITDFTLLNGYRGLHLNLLAGANTGSMCVCGGKIEGVFDSGVFMTQEIADLGMVSKWAFGPFEFLGFGNAGVFKASMAGSTTPWLSYVTLSGIVAQLNGDNERTAAPVGIHIGSNQKFTTVSANTVVCSSAGGASMAVFIEPYAAVVGHGGNTLSGCATNVVNGDTAPPGAF